MLQVITAFAVTFFALASASAQDSTTEVPDTWHEYKRADLDRIIHDLDELFRQHPGIHFILPRKVLVRARAFPVVRELSPEARHFLDLWPDHWAPRQPLPVAFKNQVLLRGVNTTVWMPIQPSLLPPFEAVLPGRPVDLYVTWLGIASSGQAILTINSFLELPLNAPLVVEQ